MNPLFRVGQATGKDKVNAPMLLHTVGQFMMPCLASSKELKVGDLICHEKVAVKAKAKLADAEVDMAEAKKRKTCKGAQ